MRHQPGTFLASATLDFVTSILWCHNLACMLVSAEGGPPSMTVRSGKPNGSMSLNDGGLDIITYVANHFCEYSRPGVPQGLAAPLALQPVKGAVLGWHQRYLCSFRRDFVFAARLRR